VASLEAQGQRALRRPDAPVPVQNRAAAIQEMVDRFYENQLRQKLELTDEQVRQVRPMLRLALRERREIIVRRARLVNSLREAIDGAASEDDLRQRSEDVDNVNTETQASQERFLRGVDQYLSVQQRAKLRVFEATIEQQIRNMLNRARAPGPQ
jgi:hypothetical protein